MAWDATLRADALRARETGLLAPRLRTHELAADWTLATVLRVAARCIGDGKLQHADGEPYAEGRSRGWPGDAGRAAYNSFAPQAAGWNTRWPYGCWFYLVAPNTTLLGERLPRVNVGRSLRALSRSALHRRLRIPCNVANDPHCNKPPGDKLYCHRAAAEGYDSVQIAQAHASHRPELIMCSGKCATANRLVGACPPVTLRRADGAKSCRCSDRSAVLNCGKAQPLNCTSAIPPDAPSV